MLIPIHVDHTKICIIKHVDVWWDNYFVFADKDTKSVFGQIKTSSRSADFTIRCRYHPTIVQIQDYDSRFHNASVVKLTQT